LPRRRRPNHDPPSVLLVKLGQDYLPTRRGTAASVTLGLAVSARGVAAPA
jgi:FSR family fosmidomycin resistance protein-like MFS transporter